MNTAVNPIRHFYDALAAGDVPRVLSLLAAELEWTEAERFPYYGGTWRTPQAVLEGLFMRINQDWERFEARPDGFVAEGDQVVSFGAYAGKHKRSGRLMNSPFAHHWTVRGGKITGFVQYTDTAKVLEAL
jgi:hypothetical protein